VYPYLQGALGAAAMACTQNPTTYLGARYRRIAARRGPQKANVGPFNPPGGGTSYAEVANDRGASYFDIGNAWNSFTPTEQLAANQHVLDIAISNRDRITLSVPFDMIDPDSYTAAEIRYLELHGYRQVNDTTWAPPVGGTE